MPKNRIVFDILYGLSSTGKKKVWMISVVDNETYSTIVTSHGYVGQTITVTEKNIYSGKNCGKKNETTHFEQAVSEAESTFNKKIDKQYAREDQAVTEAILPMLAHDYRKRSHDIVFPCYVQPKLDGARCIANFDNSLSSFKCTSRGGKNFGAVGSIIDSINKSIPGSLIVFDGELYSHELTFQEIMSAIKNEEEPDPNISKIKYWIYDICDTSIGFAARTAAIEKLKPFLDTDTIVIVPTFLVNNEEEMFAKHAEFISQGYEGTMVRNTNGPYVFKHRSANLQKVKDFVDNEFEIIGGEEGCGLSEGQCTFKCKTADGLEFGVRCIGENSVREEQLTNLDNYIGKMLKVKYQRLSDDGLPIFPVGISVRSEYE